MLFLAATSVASLMAVVAAVAYAFKRGGRDERQAVTLLAMAVIATQVVSLIEPADRFHGGEMTVDIVFAAALLAIMLRSIKFWPVWATAAQIAGTLTHLAALHSGLPLELYATTQGMWIIPILIALSIGVVGHRSTLKRR